MPNLNFRKVLSAVLSIVVAVYPVAPAYAGYMFKKSVKSLAPVDASTVTPGIVTWSTNLLNFGALPLNTESVEKSVVFANTGGSAVFGVGVFATGPFSVASTCATSLAPGQSCVASVKYNPLVAGTSLGSLTFQSSEGSHVINLEGQGLTEAVGPNSNALIFGDLQVGLSQSQTVTVSNSGLVASSNTFISYTGSSDIAVTENTCGSYSSRISLASGQTCSFKVTVTPSAIQSVAGQVSVWSNNTASNVSIQANGVGTTSAEFSASDIDFGVTAVSSTTVRTVKIFNTGTVPLAIYSGPVITGSSNMTTSTVCDSLLAVGAFCDITIAFDPTANVAYTGVLTLNTNAGIKSVSMHGQGSAAFATLTTKQGTNSFGSVDIGQYKDLEVVLTNAGEVDATGVSLSASMSPEISVIANTCQELGNAVLAASATCSLVLRYTPSQVHTVSVVVTASGSFLPAPAPLTISGQGQGSANLQVSTNAISVSQDIGVPVSTSVSIINGGNVPFNGLELVLTDSQSSSFTVSHNCPSTLNAGASCAAAITLTASSRVREAATLKIGSTIDFRTVSLELFGMEEVVALNETSKSFVAIVGSSSSSQVVLSNTGNKEVSVNSIGLRAGSDSSFMLANSCGSTILPDTSCILTITYNAYDILSKTGVVDLSIGSKSLSIDLYGAGLLTQASLSTNSLDYQTPVGAQEDKAVLITNTGNTTIAVDSVQLTSGSSTKFSTLVSNCGAALTSGAYCTISVKFSPTTTLEETGTLEFRAAGSLRQVHLSGTGLQATAILSASSIAFENVDENNFGTSAVTLNNTGNTSLLINTNAHLRAGLDSTFSITQNTCVAGVIAAGSSCSVTVKFSPTNRLAQTGVLDIETNLGTKSVDLSGTGKGAQIFVSPVSQAFFANVGQSSVSTPFTVSATGNKSVTLTSIGVDSTSAGSFTYLPGTCGSALEAGATCTVYVQFNAVDTVSRDGTLTVQSSVGNILVPITGQGLQAGFLLSSHAIEYAPAVGATESKSVAIINSGNTSLALANIQINSGSAAEFTGLTSNCGTTLGAGATCDISVSFTPSSINTVNGAVSLTIDGASQLISLTGTGQAAYATLGSTAINFNSTYVGSNTVVNATLTNTGNIPLTLNSDAALRTGTSTLTIASSTCLTGSLAPNQSCVVGVKFTPVDLTAKSGYLDFNTSDGTKSVSISAQGLNGIGTLSATSVNFSTTAVGSSSVSNITLTNTGNAPLSITTGSAIRSGSSAKYTVAASNTCVVGSLAAGSSCIIGVQFSPTNMVSQSGYIDVVTSNGTKAVALSGAGLSATSSFDVSSVSFTSTNTGSNTTTNVTLTNNGNTGLTISSAAALRTGTSTMFTLASNTCTVGTLNAGASCVVGVKFAPTDIVAQSGYLDVVTSDGTKTVSLAGTGQAATATLSASSIAYSSTAVGGNTTTSFTLTNSGNIALSLTTGAVIRSGSSSTFTLASNTCTTGTLAAGATCTVGVKFTPTDILAQTGYVDIVTALGTKTVSLTGTGLDAYGTLSSTSVGYASTAVGGNTTTSVTLTASGNTSLVISTGAVIRSGSSSTFTLASNTCTAKSLATGTTCSVGIKFTPTDITAQTGYVDIVTSDGTKTITLTGTGLDAYGTLSSTSVGYTTTSVGANTTTSVTLTASGNTSLVISTGAVIRSGSSTMFTLASNTCTAKSLATGTTCTVGIKFAPTNTSAQSGYVDIVTSDGTKTITLSGTGVGVPAATLTPTTWDSLEVINVGSSELNVFTLTNTGSAVLTITGAPSMRAGSNTNFAIQSTTCGSSVAVGGSCTVTVKHTAASILKTATLDIVTSAGTKSATMSGMGYSGV